MIFPFYGGQPCPPWGSSPISFLQRVRAISTPYKKKNLCFTFGLYRSKNNIISSSRYCCCWLSAKAGAPSLPSSSRYAYSVFWLLLYRLRWINITFPICAPAKCWSARWRQCGCNIGNNKGWIPANNMQRQAHYFPYAYCLPACLPIRKKLPISRGLPPWFLVWPPPHSFISINLNTGWKNFSNGRLLSV